jgi:hypothetical protein
MLQLVFGMDRALDGRWEEGSRRMRVRAVVPFTTGSRLSDRRRNVDALGKETL